MDKQSIPWRVVERAPVQGQASPAEVANRLLDRIEQEIARLKRARPGLAPRITKASNILVAHLAGRSAMSVVRVRIAPSGRARFLFSSLSERGVVYSVDPQSLTCSCPDHHRRGAICKHGLAAYVLQRVAQPVAEAEYQAGEAS